MTSSNLTLILIVLIAALAAFGVYLLYTFLHHRVSVKKALSFKTLLIALPKDLKPKEGETPKDFKEVIGVFEQLLANLYAIGPKQHITLEIIAQNSAIYFYICCPKEIQMLVEKQIHSFYPSAQIEDQPEFRFFKKEPGHVKATYLKLKKKYIFPLKTYPKLESEPLNAFTNILSKLGEKSSAAIQITLQPKTKFWQYACSREAKRFQEGRGYTGRARNLIADVEEAAKGENPYQRYGQTYRQPIVTPIDEARIKAFQEKGQKNGFDTQIKIISVALDAKEAEVNLDNIATAFSQLGSQELNQLIAVKPSNPSELVKNFILKSFGLQNKMILNTEEITSMFHFPNRFIETPKINWLLAKRMSAPANLPKEGTVMGLNEFRGEQQEAKIKDDDRRRHIYMIGKTGTGKTTVFLKMAENDIRAGKGVCYIDPHGDAIENLLPRIPKERADDVILFDPSDMDRPLGLNLLEWKKPEEKDFLVGEWIAIFYKLFDPSKIGIIGPQWEHWGRNAALTVMEQPGGGTLIEIPRLFTDADYREEAIANVKDPVVKSFWVKQMAQTADFHKSEMLNYFISKFGRFMTNYMMRNIIGQQKSSFDLREIMDKKKILLVNLSKGKIGEINSSLLGLVLVSKIQMAAMSRANIPEEERRDFYLYVDEFQNFTTDSFISILSEARKYRLCLNVTNQYIAQLDEGVRNAVLGNAGTMITFRIGAHDAEFIVKEFEEISESDLVNLNNYNAYIKLLIDGVASKPFSLKTIRLSETENKEIGESIKQLSRLRYGRDRTVVEQEIYERARLGGPEEPTQTSKPSEAGAL
ncbi:MAG: type IV secretion system DNA-binding domain-containing protein [Candidatus Berkelbacteria bacterium]|nr:type IV secretion system DNA-binding domain-containing protein [Candidatus Berkelbacteria bacterium]